MQDGLSPEKWLEIKTIFQVAVELPTGKRDHYLTEVCNGNPALRARVEELLAADAQMGDFIAQPIIDALPAEPAEEFADRAIGPYKIVRELGRGGMGKVFLAERADAQYQQQVAIKIIRLGLDAEFTVRRFHIERQILAALNHANIARLIDGGVTDDGQPYLVMEYINGAPIDRYCETHNLDLVARLRLFQQVCAAVQYAHQRLIIHRDIKPSNILVTADGTPKLLDFGIAKLLDPALSGEPTETTATALPLMTPEYASPEQVRGESVTAASDVYSLAVLLYKLLTGQLPYQIKNRLPYEIMQVVCDTEPQRAKLPSSYLADDLNNILMMALRKQPERRYGSVEQLSEDIRRALTSLPLLARKESLAYRGKKFLRRNYFAVIASAIIRLSLCAGLLVSLWQARIARNERARAEARFRDLHGLARSYIFEINAGIKHLPGSTATRQLLVTRALEYLDKLAREARDDDALQYDLALAYKEIGDIQGGPYQPNIGDTAGARASYRRSAEILKLLISRQPENAELLRNLANVYEWHATIETE